MATVDHLVVAAHTLDQGAAFIQHKLGVASGGGGKHQAMGTHNRVLSLGRGQYLEVVAVDPEAQPPAFPRWFHLDDPALQATLKIRPRLIAWVARTRAIERLTLADQEQRWEIRPMQRDNWRWRFAFTADGSLPGGGLIPHLIQWESQVHPSAMMPESGCRLLSLEGTHPRPRSVQGSLNAMALGHAITIHPGSGRRPPRLVARIHSPRGEAKLD